MKNKETSCLKKLKPLAILSGLVLVGGCAPKVFQPNADIPPPVVEPPRGFYADKPKPVVKAEEIPQFKVKPIVIDKVETKKAPKQDTDLPKLKPINAPVLKYRVQRGDSFWKIARKFRVSTKELAAYNHMPLNKRLTIGLELTLPPGAEESEESIAKTKSNQDNLSEILKKKKGKVAHNKGEDGVYYVMSGDSLWKVAKRYHITRTELAKANNISTKAGLKIGQKLIIPGKKSEVDADKKARETNVKKAIKAVSEVQNVKEVVPPTDDTGLDIKEETLGDISLEPEKVDDLDLGNEDLKMDDTGTEDLQLDDQLGEGLDAELDTNLDDNVGDLDADLKDDTPKLVSDGLDMELGTEDLNLDADLNVDEPTYIEISQDTDVKGFAEKYNVRVKDLLKINKNLTEGSTLKKGEKIYLPIN